MPIRVSILAMDIVVKFSVRRYPFVNICTETFGWNNHIWLVTGIFHKLITVFMRIFGYFRTGSYLKAWLQSVTLQSGPHRDCLLLRQISSFKNLMIWNRETRVYHPWLASPWNMSYILLRGRFWGSCRWLSIILLVLLESNTLSSPIKKNC